jgi:ferredoxin
MKRNAVDKSRRIQRFTELFKVPEAFVPNLSQFLTEEDIALVLTVEEEGGSVGQIAKRLGMTEKATLETLESAYDTYLLDKSGEEGQVVFRPGTFFHKMAENDCLVDSFGNIDKGVRRRLSDYCYATYKEGMGKPLISRLLKKQPVDYDMKAFLYRDEWDDFLDAADVIDVRRCNCRSLAGNCASETNTCLRFNAKTKERPRFPKKIGAQEARDIIKAAYKKGLMQSVNGDWRINGPRWMCNCCSCCCWPTRLGQEEKVKAIWYSKQHIARHDRDICNLCGTCVKRCNFGAFFHEGTEVIMQGKKKKNVTFDETKCWGCGICIETCPEGAIILEEIEENAGESRYQT